MILEVKVPGPGESITEVEVGKWLVPDGAVVRKGQEIAEIESDKATLTLVADESGRITIKVEEGKTIAVGEIACLIDTSAGIDEPAVAVEESNKNGVPAAAKPIVSADDKQVGAFALSDDQSNVKITSVAKKMMEDHGLSLEELISGLKRIGRKEVEAVLNLRSGSMVEEPVDPGAGSRELKRERMTVLRRKLSERLVAVKNETAMLTTFNEIDMSYVMGLRTKYQQQFVEKHGFKLGFMSFFTKALALAAQSFPMVNSMIEGDEIVTPGFVDVGIAVSTPKGLMVPIVRNAEIKSIALIEAEIKELAEKARTKKISVAELSGGTITITNGGVFGSLLSTPIINPPQSAILGMHNIVERPVALNNQVIIRPMMYVALSYDHRIIDGKDSVSFLVKVKELIENPERMYSGGKDPGSLMLGL